MPKMKKMHNVLFDKTCVNLNNVTNIKIRPDGHIIFYYDYVTNKGGNILPDKIYIDNANTDFINTDYFKENFKEYSEGKYININYICSIKFFKEKNECIVNLNHLHTYNNKEMGKIELPKYVKISCTYDEFLKFCEVQEQTENNQNA